MARYRRVETKVWLDSGFRAFSAPQPNAQTLWMYLLCGPRTTIFPGLLVAREEVMASDLGWPLESFRKAFAEAFAKDRLKVDWNAGIVVLQRALFDADGDVRESSKPGNPNILKGWAKEWEQIPECPLKDEYIKNLRVFCEALKETFLEAFDKALGKAYAKASRNQDQYQEQKQDQDLKSSARPSGGVVQPGLASLETAIRRNLGDVGVQRAKGRAKKQSNDWTQPEIAIAMLVLEKLGAQSGVAYSGTDEHKRLIIRLLRRGVTEVELRGIVGYCAIELDWKDKPEMRAYLRPETLFGPQTHAKYLDAARQWLGTLPPEQRPQPSIAIDPEDAA
jgi:uncharacterized phage protein (TIGR02220 family)